MVFDIRWIRRMRGLEASQAGGLTKSVNQQRFAALGFSEKK
jgi:hypothetical protein